MELKIMYVSRITELAIRLTESGQFTFFVNYSGHVKSLALYAYDGKWCREKQKERIMDENIYLDSENATKELKELKEYLTELLYSI